MAGRISSKERRRKNELMAAGFRKHMARRGGLIVDSDDKTADDIEADLARRIQAEDAVTAAHAAHHGAVLARARIERETDKLYRAVRETALIMFASSPEILADFGLAPRKPPRALTVDEKVAAVAKAARTRALRHFMGRRQRLRIRADAAPLTETKTRT
jgi:hypothetical protein